MSRREKMLAIAVGAMLLLVGGSKGYLKYHSKAEDVRSDLANAELALSTARAAVQRGLRARHRLAQWRKASLPANMDIAKSLYQDWLHEQLTSAELQVKELRNSNSRTKMTSEFQQLTYNIEAQGSLDALAKFLYQFYSANHLHRISAASLKPTDDRTALRIGLTIDALVLPDCKRADELASGQGEPLEHPLDEYRDSIQGRNIFVAYKPGASQKNSELLTKQEGEAAKAFVTGMTQGGNGWRFSVRMEDSGKVLYFREGDSIQLGKLDGTVASIDARQVVVQTADEMRTFKLGQSFAQEQ